MLINLKVEYRERYIVRKPELIGRERERKRKNKQSFKMNALCIWLCKDLDQSNRLNEFQKNQFDCLVYKVFNKRIFGWYTQTCILGGIYRSLVPVRYFSCLLLMIDSLFFFNIIFVSHRINVNIT
jgi:hypothetical protein